MKLGKRIGVVLILLFVCCSTVVVSAQPFAPPVHPQPSWTGATGFLIGRASNIHMGYDEEFLGDYIGFHARCVFFLAIADPLMCSLVRLYIDKDMRIGLESEPQGFIGNSSMRIMFKTMVPGPI
jgi:hypothetical protein